VTSRGRAHSAKKRLTLLEGAAEFVSEDRVRVGERIVQSDRIFLALGMRPSVPEVDGLRDGPWLTNETVMDLEEIPGHLIVLGGGYIGCELGQAFRRFGSEVSIVQRPPRLLPGEEPDVSTVIERSLREEGIDVLTGHELRSVRWTDGRPTVGVTGPDGASRSLEGTHLLLAAGRTPNTDMLALERACVELDPRGFVSVDDELRTTAAGIWAIGDVNGYQPFTRVCQEEAKLAFENAFREAGLRMRRESLPHAVFTDPEVGSVGLTEAGRAGARPRRHRRARSVRARREGRAHRRDRRVHQVRRQARHASAPRVPRGRSPSRRSRVRRGRRDAGARLDR
jgi:pyruvate/2-oxoglutarate dehydrogenase complex dihydrolipoamide dehydrogenase (E3) component